MNILAINPMKGLRALGAASILLLTLTNCKKEPTASFTYTVSELTVTFTSTSSEGESFAWSFGDGEVSTEENPIHTYSVGGTYTVSLTVTNKKGSATDEQEVVVEAPTVEADAPELSFGDADGAFYAINSVSVTSTGPFPITTTIGSAVAWFVDGGTSFVDVGTVSFNQGSKTGTLEKAANNSYLWIEDDFLSSPGFSSSGGVEWSVSGGSGHPAVNGLSNGFPFPSTSEVSESADEISGSGSYTLSHLGSISDADSNIFAIHGADGSVMKTVTGTTTSVTFSSSEMASVGAGYALLQIASYNIYRQELGTKVYYVVNETVASKNVNVD